MAQQIQICVAPLIWSSSLWHHLFLKNNLFVWKKKQIVAFFLRKKYQKCLSPCPKRSNLIKPALKNSRSFLYLFLFLFLIIFLFSFPYFTFHQKLEVQKVAQSRCWTPLSTSSTCQYKFTSKYKFHLDFNCCQNPCLNAYCMIKYDRILRNSILNFNFKAFVKHSIIVYFFLRGATHIRQDGTLQWE